MIGRSTAHDNIVVGIRSDTTSGLGRRVARGTGHDRLFHHAKKLKPDPLSKTGLPNLLNHCGKVILSGSGSREYPEFETMTADTQSDLYHESYLVGFLLRLEVKP